MTVRRAVLGAMLLLMVATGCGSAARAEPSPLNGVMLYVDADDRTVHAVFDCGGKLSAAETAERVVMISYYSPDVGRGAGSCALIRLEVRLAAPLGDRTVLDAADREPIPLFDLADLDRPDPSVAVPTGSPAWSAGLACPLSAFDVPCAAQSYRVAGAPAPVVLVQALSGSKAYPLRAMAADEPPWCLGVSVGTPAVCGKVTCHPVASTAVATCDVPYARFTRYLTWLLGAQRLYLAPTQPTDPSLLIRVASKVHARNHQGPSPGAG